MKSPLWLRAPAVEASLRFALLLAAAILVTAPGCDNIDMNEPSPEIMLSPDDNTFPDRHEVTLDDAISIARKAGLDPDALAFADMVPVDFDSDGEYELAWALVAADRATYYVDPLSGGLLSKGLPTAGLAAFLESQRSPESAGLQASGRTPGSYESFPWGTNLPFCGSMSVSCGYGCNVHKGAIFWSLDWNLNGEKDNGNPVVAPFSGWVMDVSYNGDYGWQILIKGPSTGQNQFFIWRGAHLNSRSPMVPGWWVWKGRTIGNIGSSGKSTGPHLHSEMWRGMVSGRSTSGSTVPWSNWPSRGDCVDGYDGSTGRCFTSENACSSGDTCP